jgi:acyl-coenzyme A thioesterase PaaI-like protein
MTTLNTPRILKLYRNSEKIPLIGQQVFTKLFQFAAPYFFTIPVEVKSVRPGTVVATLKDRKYVHNHLGTIHAIALCNLAELVMGVNAEVTLPTTHRWIPKGMNVEYLAKAQGTLTAIATLVLPEGGLIDKQELPIEVEVRNSQGKEVFHATIRIWITAKK